MCEGGFLVWSIWWCSLHPVSGMAHGHKLPNYRVLFGKLFLFSTFGSFKLSFTNSLLQKAKAHVFLVENLQGGGGRDSDRFQVSELSQAQCVGTRKIEILLQFKHGFSNPVPGAESLCSKILLEEREETINLRLDTPPPQKRKKVCARVQKTCVCVCPLSCSNLGRPPPMQR